MIAALLLLGITTLLQLLRDVSGSLEELSRRVSSAVVLEAERPGRLLFVSFEWQ